MHVAQCDFALVSLLTESKDGTEQFVDIRNVSSGVMGSSIVGVVTTHVSPNATSATRLQSSIAAQLSWAAHAGMYAVMLDKDVCGPHEIFSTVSGFLRMYPPESCVTRVWLKFSPGEWKRWNQIRTVCDYPNKLEICLDLSAGGFSADLADRWIGEPVACFIPPEALTLEMEVFILHLLRINAQPILSTAKQAQQFKDLAISFPPLSWAEGYLGPYHDSLQLPLQPLADNMENAVYETFETDRKKYDQYELAIFRALSRMVEDDPAIPSVHLAVVGAGRGGLIDAALHAIERLNLSGKKISFKITAVEKNPNAARTLRFRANDDPLWTSSAHITVDECDMRSWSPLHVDVLISELLGSLGDNEASPECLENLMQHLTPGRGVSIPEHYVSFVEPVASARIWQSVRDAKKFSTPLVVTFNNRYFPSTPSPLYEFTHTTTSALCLNQSRLISWNVRADTSIHGLAGYFTANLFGDVAISTHRLDATENMVSWFPALLPFTSPVFVKAGEKLEVLIERKNSANKMWTEWTVIGPTTFATCNSGGVAHSVGL